MLVASVLNSLMRKTKINTGSSPVGGERGHSARHDRPLVGTGMDGLGTSEKWSRCTRYKDGDA
jgi:hypothetical protein